MDTQHIRVKKASGEESIEVSSESVNLGGMGLTEVFTDSLPHIEHLRSLWLYNNNIEEIDLTPLASGRNLRSVSLRENRLEEIDLSPLSACEQLTEIDLGDNRLVALDLTPLASLNSLRVLTVGSNPLSRLDLSPIEQCESLKELDISGIPVSCRVDLTPLFMCDSLENVKTEGSCLVVDPALRYILAAGTPPTDRLVTSAPRNKGRPNMKWFWKSRQGRAEWLSYRRMFEQVGSACFCTRLMHLLQSLGTDYAFHTTKGLLDGLGLEGLSGIDCEPRLVLQGLSPVNTYDELVDNVRSRVKGLLERQLSSNGSALFIDVEGLIEDDESELARKVVDRRVKEVKELSLMTSGREVDISGLLLTEYGLQVVTAMGVEDTRVTRDVFAAIEDRMARAGFRIATRQGRLSADPFQSLGSRSKSLASFVLVDKCHRLSRSQQG